MKCSRENSSAFAPETQIGREHSSRKCSIFSLAWNKMKGGKARWPTVCLCGLPPIEQMALDGWGTEVQRDKRRYFDCGRSSLLSVTATPLLSLIDQKTVCPTTSAAAMMSDTAPPRSFPKLRYRP